jgi:endonuclease G
MTIFKKYLWPAALLTAIFLLFAGCKDDDEASVDVVLRSDFVDCNATTNRILATGSSMSFVATIVEQDGDETWCAFDSFEPGATPPRLSKEGQVGIPMTIYLLRNEVEQERTATIDVVFADATVRRLTFTQGAYSETAWYDRKWGEQPAYRENESYVYKTYFTDLKRGGHVRNFTVCFDTGKRVAHWAAYPLTLNYVSPAVDRTDKWAYDPNNQQPVIPQSAQANIIGYYGSGYARGHQVPSADRYSTIGTNEMTFYATNIMPQNGNFNSGVWGALESKIREVRSLHNADTIFVVTGTYFADNKTITDKSGKKVGVPSNCWKVLLRGSGGKAVWECSAGELHAIGFWFQNNLSNSGSIRDHSTTVADIERKTGFTFFRNIPPEAADAVKAQNRPSDWGI